MRQLLFSSLLVVLGFLIALPAAAQLPRLEEFLKGLEAEDTYFGSVLVVQGGATVFQGHYGFRDEARTQRNDAGSVYYVADLSETYTAALIMMAQEKALLSLESPVGTYLPEFKDKPELRIQDLLCHAAGLPVFRLNDGGLAKPGTLTLADLAAGAAERPLLSTPGSRYDWESKDYDLLGYLLERITHKSYPTLLAEWILTPLALTRTGTGLAPAWPEFARSGSFPRLQQELGLWKNGYVPSFSVYTTIGELRVFLTALTSGRLVSPESYGTMQKAFLYDEGFGIGLGMVSNASGVKLNGGWGGGYNALFQYDPRYDVWIYALGNKWQSTTGTRLRKTLVPEIYAALGLKE